MALVVYLHPFGDRACEGFVGPSVGHDFRLAWACLELSVSVACSLGAGP